MLREPQLEKCCVSTSAPHTLSKEKFLEPEWAGSPTTAAGELRPQDLPDGSTEEKESVQGAGPGGRPWTGLCCSETPSSSGNWCVSRSLHTPAELRVSAGVLISEGLLLQRVFCVGFGVWCLRTIAKILWPCLKEERWATWAEGWEQDLSFRVASLPVLSRPAPLPPLL